MSYGAEIVELSEIFFRDDIDYDEECQQVLNEEHTPEVLRTFLQEIEGIENFERDEIKAALKRTQKESGYKGKKLFMPIRVAVTGATHGPDIANSLALIGKEKTMAMIKKLLN